MHLTLIPRATRAVALFFLTLTTPAVLAGLNHTHPGEPAPGLSHAQQHRLQHAEAQRARAPDDLDTALLLARMRLELAASLRDPGLSQPIPGILAPWWNDDSNLDVLIMKAAYWQHDHQFALSRQSLSRILDLQPGHTQASLILAAVEAAQGDWQASRRACGPVVTQQPAWLSAACLGQSAASPNAITQSLTLIRTRPGDGSNEDRWAASIQQELEQRLHSGQFTPVAAHPPEPAATEHNAH